MRKRLTVAVATIAVVIGAASIVSASASSTEGTSDISFSQCARLLQQAVGADHLKGELSSQLSSVTDDGQQSTLLESQDYSMWCQGREGALNFVLIDSPWYSYPEPLDSQVSVGPVTQDLSHEGRTFVLGRAGGNVISVDVGVPGQKADVALTDGWWTASWVTGSEDELERVKVTFVTRDGTPHEALLSDLEVDD